MRKTNFPEELFSLNSIQVYHGSDMLVKKPKIMQPTRALGKSMTLFMGLLPMIQFLRHLSHTKMEF